MLNEEFIIKLEDKYIIQREFDGVEYNFGEYSSLDEAIEACNKLDYDGWPIKVDLVKTNNENNVDEIKYPHMSFSVKVGKSYKHRFLVIHRKQVTELIPPLPYESGGEIIVDGISARMRFNIVPRIIIDKDSKKLLKHLEELNKINPSSRITANLLLNQSNLYNNFYDSKLLKENDSLKKELDKANDLIIKLNKEYNEINEKVDELESLYKFYTDEINRLNNIVDDSKDILLEKELLIKKLKK